MLATEIIRLTDVTKTYQSGAGEQTVLNKVSFAVNKGEFIGIIGDSGSGKTTLLRLLGGLDAPTSGKVVVLGKRLERMGREELDGKVKEKERGGRKWME